MWDSSRWSGNVHPRKNPARPDPPVAVVVDPPSWTRSRAQNFGRHFWSMAPVKASSKDVIADITRRLSKTPFGPFTIVMEKGERHHVVTPQDITITRLLRRILFHVSA